MELKDLAKTMAFGDITDLQAIPTDIDVQEFNGTDRSGKPYSYFYFELYEAFGVL